MFWLLGADLAEAGRRDAPDPKRDEAMEQMRDGSLAVGDPAPDAAVVALDGEATTLLAARKARPVVLIFGSFT
jgi:hypothetical protein